MWRSLLAALAVTLAAAGAFASATDGFRVVTTEGARRLAVEQAPRPFPRVPLEDQDGRPVLAESLRGRVVLVEFIYTRCPTVCSTLGEAFARVARALPGTTLLSISFDIDHDGPEELRHYAARHGADGRHWRVVRPTSRHDLDRLLDAAGVVVIPDGWGGYQHNAAVHLLDHDGRLVRILDFEPVAALIDEVRPWLRS
ncbi:SCO family protein [Magnetospirillum sp. SS-4]|uniref:SCO family protein n=1 Tax=Magnetospirillum sp. SS-4 TaxID=2681465 RepID=UPI001384F633|nr:SCO family protein [Magnetospirillum sp. SS-4]CAA7624978.1 Electron transport protein SCO1/SenC [Magnetospirillum sp. SS-4]